MLSINKLHYMHNRNHNHWQMQTNFQTQQNWICPSTATQQITRCKYPVITQMCAHQMICKQQTQADKQADKQASKQASNQVSASVQTLRAATWNARQHTSRLQILQSPLSRSFLGFKFIVMTVIIIIVIVMTVPQSLLRLPGQYHWSPPANTKTCNNAN